MAQFTVKAERGTWNAETGKSDRWEGTGDLAGALEIVRDNQNPNEHLLGMALQILEDQMEGLEVGGTIAYNWACSVLDVIVKRIA